MELWCTRMEVRRGRRFESVTYPYVPGQSKDDLGRMAWEIRLTTRWFGEGWKQRLENFLARADIDGSAGELALPDHGARLQAVCEGTEEDRDLLVDGDTVVITFHEDSHERHQYIWDWSSSPATEADELVPSDATDVKSAMDDYTAAIRDPGTTTEERRQALVSVLDEIADARVTDPDTVDAVVRDDQLVLARARAIQGFPDQDELAV